MSNKHARQILTAAISKGFFAPAYEHDCVDCGDPATDYDHRDYNKPLEVEPVCHACNMKRGKGVAFAPVIVSRGKPVRLPAEQKNRIAHYRKLARISQVELAAALGVTQGCISSWGNDRNEPGLQHIKQILAAVRQRGIQISFEELFP